MYAAILPNTEISMYYNAILTRVIDIELKSERSFVKFYSR